MLLRFIALASLVLSAILGLVLDVFQGLTWLWAFPLLSLGFFILGLALAFGYLIILSLRVDMDQVQENDDPFYRHMTEVYLDSIVPLVRIGVREKGMEKVPKEGRFVLVCNHCSNSDPILLLRAFAGRQVAFISKKENQKLFIIGPMMHKLLCQLLDRENDREALKTIVNCIKILKEDKASIGVFPEGGIAKDRKLHRFRPGVFKIAQKANVPIVVCTLKNTRYVIPNMARYRHSDVELTVLQTIPAQELKGVTTTEIAERVYQLMADDLGPENVAEEG